MPASVGSQDSGPSAKIADAGALILDKSSAIPEQRALLVAVSGIDGSGKGYITERIASYLHAQRSGVVTINVDGWLQLPNRRFSEQQPGEHFYENGIRFAEMFEKLVLPLQRKRSHQIRAALADPTGEIDYREHVYDFSDVEIILLEGIFLLKRAFRGYYDFALWVDCTFETALERALERGQEGLSPEQTIRDYETIYFAAQRIHLGRDNPLSTADLIIPNDPRLDPLGVE
jgi:uridine kinase